MYSNFNMTVGQYFFKLRILHWAMGFGIILLFGVAIFLYKEGELPLLEDQGLEQILNVLVIAFIGSIIPAAFFLFNSMISRLDKKLHLTQKLEAYQKFYIIRLAMIDAAALACTMVLLLTLSIVPMMAWAITVLIFGMLFPSKKEIKKVLDLDEGEKLKLEQDSTVLDFSDHPAFKNRMN